MIRSGERVRLSGAHLGWALAAFVAVALSGALWLVAHYGVDPDADAPGGLERWSLRLHGAAAMLALFLLGTVAARHALPAWRTGRNRTSGALLATAFVVLTASGYVLYYGGETVHAGASGLHWGVGLASAAVLATHAYLGCRPAGPARRARRHPG